MILSVATSALSLMTLATPSALVRFPGEHAQAVGPAGRFAIVWLPADQAGGGAEHQLLLKDLRSGEQRPLLHFGRWVDVVWSPDGTRVAITNGVGSDATEASVYSVRAEQPVAVWAVLEHQVGKEQLAFAAGAHHMYVEAKAWENDTTLAVRVWGYGGAKPFDRRFRVRLPK